MANILVTGANGQLGTELRNRGFSLLDDVFYTDVEELDITNPKAVNSFVELHDIDTIINCAAYTAVDLAEDNEEKAARINRDAVGNLAQAALRYGCLVIHLSTDFVFDGTATHLYRENDEPQPVNYYGETKLKSERLAASLCPDHAIVRVEVVYGTPLPGQHGNIAQLVANRIRNNEEIFVVSDQLRTPTYVGDISQGIECLIESPRRGIYHLCGKDEVSIADMAYRVADVLGEGHSLIRPQTTATLPDKTPRPLRTGMSIEKACRELGYRPLSLEEGLRRMFS